MGVYFNHSLSALLIMGNAGLFSFWLRKRYHVGGRRGSHFRPFPSLIRFVNTGFLGTTELHSSTSSISNSEVSFCWQFAGRKIPETRARRSNTSFSTRKVPMEENASTKVFLGNSTSVNLPYLSDAHRNGSAVSLEWLPRTVVENHNQQAHWMIFPQRHHQWGIVWSYYVVVLVCTHRTFSTVSVSFNLL